MGRVVRGIGASDLGVSSAMAAVCVDAIGRLRRYTRCVGSGRTAVRRGVDAPPQTRAAEL